MWLYFQSVCDCAPNSAVFRTKYQVLLVFHLISMIIHAFRFSESILRNLYLVFHKPAKEPNNSKQLKLFADHKLLYHSTYVISWHKNIRIILNSWAFFFVSYFYSYFSTLFLKNFSLYKLRWCIVRAQLQADQLFSLPKYVHR